VSLEPWFPGLLFRDCFQLLYDVFCVAQRAGGEVASVPERGCVDHAAALVAKVYHPLKARLAVRDGSLIFVPCRH
jgi:hypothetical protein